MPLEKNRLIQTIDGTEYLETPTQPSMAKWYKPINKNKNGNK